MTLVLVPFLDPLRPSLALNLLWRLLGRGGLAAAAFRRYVEYLVYSAALHEETVADSAD